MTTFEMLCGYKCYRLTKSSDAAIKKKITNFYVTALCHFCLSLSFYNNNRKNNNCFIINFYSIIINVCNWRSFFRFSVVAIFVVVAAAKQTLRFDEKLENLKNSFIFRGHKLSWMACFKILPPLRFVVDQFWKILPIKTFTERAKNCETAKVLTEQVPLLKVSFLNNFFTNADPNLAQVIPEAE